jgi:hypothetical protein
MDKEREYDVNSREFFEEFAKALERVAEDDRRMGLLSKLAKPEKAA